MNLNKKLFYSLLIVFILSILAKIVYNIYKKDNNWQDVINEYQHNLVSSEPLENRMEKYKNILSKNPILMINFKNISSSPSVIGEVPKPKVLGNKEEILNFQRMAYKNNKWTKLWYEIIDHKIGTEQGYAVVLGTHIVYKKGQKDPIYVQALEMFGLVKENNEWKLGAASFIDFVWSEPKGGKSKSLL